MAEKLSIVIALEGAAEIEQQLEGIGAAGTKAFGEIASAAEKVGGFKELDPKDVTDKLQKFGVTGKEAIDKITAAVRSAGRLEQIAGGVAKIETGFAKIGAAASTMSARVTAQVNAVGAAMNTLVGRTGQVARALRLVGISGGLGAAAGAAAVQMERMADAARVLEGNLQAAFRNAAAGTAFFNQIQQSAQNAGASLESTGKVMLDIVKILESGLAKKGISFAPGENFKQTREQAQQLFDTLQQGMKLSGVRADEANKAIAKLFAELATKGQLSGDTLRKFAAEFPQLANELVKFLGIPGQSMEKLADQVDRGIRKIDIPKFINAIKRASPEIKKLSDAFEPTLAQRMDTIAGAWDRLLNSFAKSPAGDVIRRVMDDIAKGLDELAKKQEDLAKGRPITPPVTTTGKLLQAVFDEFDQFNKNVEIAKQNWQRFKDIVSQPVQLILSIVNLTPVGLALNKVLQLIEKLRQQPPVKITVPFEADPEPAWVEAYLGFIEKIKSAFKSILKPEAEESPPQQPAWVEAYLGFIERIKTAFQGMFKTEEEGPPQQPAWVEAYLGWIEKVKAAFQSMLKKPEVGGGVPGGVPLMGGDLTDRLPRELQDIGARRIEDRRDPGLESMRASAQAVFDQIQQLGTAAFAAVSAAGVAAFAAISQAAQQFAQAIVGAFQGVGQTIATALDVSAVQAAFSELESSITTSMQNITTAIQQATQALRELISAANEASAATSGIDAGGGGGDDGGFARGGLIRGRGTGTSDSILARLSDREYVIRAAAVDHFGVPFFNALNALRLPKFSIGGLIDGVNNSLSSLAIPSFAGGGELAAAPARGSLRPLTLVIDNGLTKQTFAGLLAPSEVADRVVRYATARQVTSAGRKSSSFK
jgi:tape measure domain-containing protein